MEERYFQWIVGDRRGEIVVFDKIEVDDGDSYIVFKDESRINEILVAPINQQDLTGKVMAEIDSYTNCWTFKEEYVGRQEEKWDKNADGESVCVIPFNPGRKVTKLIPPKRTPPKKSNFGTISNTPIIAEAISTPKEEIDKHQEIKVSYESDPVYIILSKAKKKDHEIEIQFSVSLPDKSLYQIADSSFEDGGTKFIDFIIDDLDISDIKNAIKDGLVRMYTQGEEAR